MAVAAWILVVALLVAGAAGVGGGILSPSLVLDLVALWPLYALVLIAGVVGWWRGRRHGSRAGAILPLAIISVVVFTTALHLGGWEELPSAQARLTGAAVADLGSSVEMVIQIPGELEISPIDGDVGYRIEPLMRGGPIGFPRALETSVDGELTVAVEQSQEHDWYRFSGWRVGLSPQVDWRLVLNGRLAADLSDLDVSAMAVAGSGVVDLGAPPALGGRVAAAGDLVLTVPRSVAVVATGNVVVPGGWEEDGDERRAPVTDGPAWSIRVSGENPVTIRER